jgi:hypothetical protein
MVTEHEQFVRNWYASACAAARHFDRTAAETACIHCGRPKKDHHYEELKCNLYVTSTRYLAQNRDNVDVNTKTIELLEKLAEVRGWQLQTSEVAR